MVCSVCTYLCPKNRAPKNVAPMTEFSGWALKPALKTKMNDTFGMYRYCVVAISNSTYKR